MTDLIRRLSSKRIDRHAFAGQRTFDKNDFSITTRDATGLKVEGLDLQNIIRQH
jgi:hypothetical protein